LAIGEFSLATVAEGKTIKRAAIPIMVNNSPLIFCLISRKREGKVTQG
jgi:hypothetical protein